MTATKNRALPGLMKELRSLLRSRGLTIHDIAGLMDVSGTSVKRWFAGRGLTTERLEDLCELAGTTLLEVAAQTPPQHDLADQLTLSQEEALTENSLLTFLFFILMNGWSPEDLHKDFDVPTAVIDAQLVRLERLALIDRLPGGRVRCRIDRSLAWHRGPMRRQFELYLKWQFAEMDFGNPDAVFTAGVHKLSPTGFARLEELIERFRRNMLDLADDDRRHALMPKSWYAILLATRPFSSESLNKYARSIGDTVAAKTAS